MNKEQQELMESILGYFDRICHYLPDVIRKIRKEGTDVALEDIINLLEGLQWINDAIHLTKMIHSIDAQYFIPIYKELIEAFEAKDNLLLADVLQYELMPAIEEASRTMKSEFSLKLN